MSATEVFIKGLQEATGKNPFSNMFWKDYPEKANHTFQDALDKYAEYYQTLNPTQREAISTIFWDQIKEIGTPIIETHPQKDDEANVYFLFPKDKLENSNDLYLQGEFHGYGGVNVRNKLDEHPNTGIMYRVDSMPINSIINYQYQQESSSTLNDDNSSHRNMYHHRYSGGSILRVNPDRDQSYLGKHLGKKEEENYWVRMLSSESTNSSKPFRYHTTLYSDSTNKLRTCDAPLPQKVDIYDPVPANLEKIKGEDLSGSPYANFTHAVHIFKPTSDKIENVIVFNDGRPYILAGIIDQVEKMVNTGKLSANTAFVFIDPLQGLAKTMPGIEKDERFNMGGMGVRIIDFDKGIESYITFLENLFPRLSEKDINIPNDPKSRVMVGSSLSGTASIYIALKKPDLFNGIIAQSPSPSNDGILIDVEGKQEANIQLSGGFFEQPRYHGADTDFFKYVNELADRLSLQFHKGLHGHNNAAWIEDLERSLPASLSAIHKASSHTSDAQELKKSTEHSVSSQSIFSQQKESPIKTEKKDETKIQVLRERGG